MQVEDWLIEDFATVDSTNNVAQAESKNFNGHRVVFSAASQTAGRGRLGRRWMSPPGNLFMSQLFYLTMPISDLVFITSLSIAETIGELTTGLNIAIKWPNDVLVDGSKISGILIETGEQGTAIVGVGINLISSPKDQDVLYPVTDLQSLGFDITRETFLQTYLKHFNHNVAERQINGFSDIRTRWLSYACRLNEVITVNLTDRQIKGIFKGIDEQGLLLLEHNGGIIKIAAGDVFFPPKG